MEKTTNYQLNQWDAADRVQRTDFNADNAKIDAAIKAAAVKAAEEHIYVGTFVGDGQDGRVIQLPWTPKFLLLIGKIFDNATISYLFQNGCCYHEKYVVVDVSDAYRPLLNGSKVTIQIANWYNANGQTTRYILFR